MKVIPHRIVSISSHSLLVMKVYISVTYTIFLKMGCKLMLKSDVYLRYF